MKKFLKKLYNIQYILSLSKRFHRTCQLVFFNRRAENFHWYLNMVVTVNTYLSNMAEMYVSYVSISVFFSAQQL